MYFRRLEVQGFKTFANRTEFEFDSGITAIVGPNGSGKSNIADALRWVLGEQTIRLLRAKRGEDLIFAGSQSRAPLGMAEVTITLDNSEGWFPLPYGEVTVTRRAFRSGDNEYLINRQRVRLRDVTDLLAKAKLGQNTYTVIGQGLVDAVLSLRPEERRELIEEAADIRRYYTKLNETQTKLEATEQNIVRADDIAAEILPRIASLEKQARLAEQRLGLARELERLQRIWYAHLQSKAIAKLGDAVARETAMRQRLTSLETGLGALAHSLTQIREMETETRACLARWREDGEPLRVEHTALAKEVAIDGERMQACARQMEELRQEVRALKADEVAQAQRLVAAREQMAAVEAERGNAAAAITRLEEALEAARQSTAEAAAGLSTLRSSAFTATASVGDLQRKLAQTRDRLVALEREIHDRDSAIQERRSKAAALQARAELSTTTTAELGAKLDSLQRRRQEIQGLAAASRKRQEELAGLVEGHSRKKSELQTRHELISKWEDSQTGYYPGVRAIVLASRRRRDTSSRDAVPPLDGIIGVVGKVIRSAARVETAIEVALGGRVQDIIVERWQDAEKAITFLKGANAGRATFLPLDTIRAAAAQLPHLKTPGVLGLASELVHFEPRFQAIVNLLLGRTIVVEDLKVARQALRECPTGWQIVTISGEMVRSSGAITGGSISQQSGVLSRMRELRDLPDELAAVDERLKETQDLLSKEKSEQRRLSAEQDALDREDRDGAARIRVAREELSSVQREITRLQSDLEWLGLRKQELSNEQHKLVAQEAACAEQVQRISSESIAASEILQAAEAEAHGLRQEEGRLSVALSDLKVSLALAQQRQASLAETLTRGDGVLEALRAQIDTKQTRAGQIDTLRLSIEERLTDGQARLQGLDEKLRELESLVGPAERRIAELGAEYNSRLQEETRLRIAQHEALSQHQQAALEVQRARDELEALNQRIRDELGNEGEADANSLLGEGNSGPNLAGAVPPEVGADGQRKPEEVKRRIDQLKGELRSLASVNPRAIEEYQETLSRYNFLVAQAEDLRRGAESLRQVAAELHKTMKKRFEETFKAVAAEFPIYFRTLFGGGSARLTLTEPHDIINTGVDIVAQPPGKRLQNLALLSGGERALTGVALLFAILKINPTPVCVLDEVDAALDEANVGRFRTALSGLAQATQFIIITHNRGTMETANALYGVALADNGISRIVSLRLSDIDHKSNGSKPKPEMAGEHEASVLMAG